MSSPTSLWVIPAFRRRFIATVISRLGDLVFDTTAVLWVGAVIGAGRAWAPLAVSGVLIAAAAPMILVGPVAGVVCDRTDRARILLWSNLVQAIAMTSLLAVPLLGDRLPVGVQLGWIYAVVAATSAASQFFGPASTVLLTKTVPQDRLTEAVSASQVATMFIGVVAPPLAAPLLFFAGAGWALGLDAASFAVSCLLLAGVRWDSAPEPGALSSSFFQSFLEGVRTIAHSRVLVCVLVAITVATLGTGILNTLEIFFVTQVLHGPAAVVGIMGAVTAVGVIVGTLLAPRLERAFSPERVFVVALFLIGAATIACARSTSVVAASTALLVAGLPLGAINTVAAPMLVRTVPAQLLGRSLAAMNLLPAVASLLAMAASGWLASTLLRGVDLHFAGQHVGPIDLLVTVAGLLMAGAAVMVGRPLLRAGSAAAAASAAPEPQPASAA